MVPAARVRLNTIAAMTNHSALHANWPEHVGQCGVPQVGVDLFDDGVAVVGLVRVHRVHELAVGGGEEMCGNAGCRTGLTGRHQRC